MGRWAVVGVESSVAWPKDDTEVEFRGETLVLRPATENRLATVAFQHRDTMTLEDAILFIRHYLSSLAWVERAAIREVAITGGSAPFFLGRGPGGGVITDHFRHDYLPDPTDSRSRLALAFYREALSLNSIPYQYLSFFKIINIPHSSGSKQKAWINSNLVHVRDARATERIRELRSLVPDIAAYLYESGRCAIAHAFSKPLVDPENLEDSRRLGKDLPIVQALAELLIETELGIKARETIWREHLYHLEGFRDWLGPELVRRLKGREKVESSELPPLPTITIAVRDKPLLESFGNLMPTPIEVEQGTIWLRCDSTKGVLQVLLGLAVADEYLIFNPLEHVAFSPERTIPALEAQRDQTVLLCHLIRNGQLEIINGATGGRLGRTDAYMGRNIDMTATLANLDHTLLEVDEAIKLIRSSPYS